MHWITKDWVFYILLYRPDLDFNNLRKDDLVEILNIIRLYYLKRMAHDDEFLEFDYDFKKEIRFWLGNRDNDWFLM